MESGTYLSAYLLFSRMSVNIIQYRRTVGIFSYRTFVKESNIKKLSLNLHNNFCNNRAFVLFNNSLFCSLFLSVSLVLKDFVSESTKYRDAWILLFTLTHSWVGIWLYTLVISLSGDVEVNPGPRRGGVCIYYKNFLHLRVLDIQYLHECINIELKIGDKLCYITALHRLSSQSQDEFEKFSEKLELN